MRTFAQFFESSELMIPNSSSLDEFLDTLVGMSIKDILDKSSYINLCIGNKYGFRDADNEYDRAVTRYHNKPLTKQDLSDDGSEEFKNLTAAFQNLAVSRARKIDQSAAEDEYRYIEV